MSISSRAQSYENGTTAFLVAAELVTPKNIDNANSAGWTPRQIIHHIADSESQSAARFFCASRASSLQILRNVTEEDLEKFAVHSEHGKFTLENWLDVYSRHPVDHANQLREAISE